MLMRDMGDLLPVFRYVDSHRQAAIEEQFQDMLDTLLNEDGKADASSFMTGVMLGARLREADEATCGVVLAKIERDTSSEGVPAERMEALVKGLAEELVQAA